MSLNIDPKLTKACSPEMQGVFKACFHMGFLQQYKRGMLTGSFKEYFFLLSNVGLMVYRNPGVTKQQV